MMLHLLQSLTSHLEPAARMLREALMSQVGGFVLGLVAQWLTGS